MLDYSCSQCIFIPMFPLQILVQIKIIVLNERQNVNLVLRLIRFANLLSGASFQYSIEGREGGLYNVM